MGFRFKVKIDYYTMTFVTQFVSLFRLCMKSNMDIIKI